METVNFISLHDVEGEEDGDGNNGCVEFDSQRASSKEKEDGLISEEAGYRSDVQCIDLGQPPEASPEKGLIEGGDLEMEIENLNEVPALRDSGCGLERNGVQDLNHEPGRADDNVVDSSCLGQLKVNFSETVVVAGTLNSTVGDEAGCLTIQDGMSIGIKKMKGNCVKRSRVMFDGDNPSVFVKYNSLTRSSKLKLEELLQQWSEWHAQHGSSAQDPAEPLESGEDTFFPALHIGLEKAMSVSFWMDKQTRTQQNDEFIPLDDKSVPLYDRGYALGLRSDDGTSNVERSLEIVDDAPRCFNCGSYSHALKECPKPRDNTAVNNARKHHNAKRNQNSGSRNQARYYQNSPSGKYDGLRPGALDAETRKLLGLGELDPPPWLSRMREIGYPPGYIDPDEDDKPSGITIFADDEFKEEQEDGEIIEADKREPEKKMSVEYPGINGPIPKNADKRLWAGAIPPILDTFANRSRRRPFYTSSETISRVHHDEERWSGSESRDDGPPGVDPTVSSYPPRYGSSYESSYNSRSLRHESPGRFESDRGRRSRFHDEGSVSSSTRLSPLDYGSSRYRNRVDESRDDYDFDYSPRDRLDRYCHRSRR